MCSYFFSTCLALYIADTDLSSRHSVSPCEPDLTIGRMCAPVNLRCVNVLESNDTPRFPSKPVSARQTRCHHLSSLVLTRTALAYVQSEKLTRSLEVINSYKAQSQEHRLILFDLYREATQDDQHEAFVPWLQNLYHRYFLSGHMLPNNLVPMN